VPALAIAAALRDRGAEVHWIGGERAERELVPAAGLPFHELRVAGLDRRNPLRAVRAVALSARAVARARRIVRELRPAAVLGGGGYVAGPVGMAAVALRVPLVLSEADSHLGLANRLLAPLAKRVFLAFPIEGRYGERYLVTGRPVPPGTGEADPEAARRRFDIPGDRPCVLVFGGSLGARSLNQAALDAFARPGGGSPPFTVLHASGRRDYEDLRDRLRKAGEPAHYRLEAYVEPFADALAAADLAVARAGGSVFELAAAGVPAILVPYPHATADHQTGNALWMLRGGAARIVPDADLDGARLAHEVADLIEPTGRLEEMSRAARALARPDAAARIADETLAAAGAGR
jgi:UDP-N-acetylglucosamine--N-acetylmuramyl-(pentapeptide) pyrophosphoryl-undecaprenol N-acetylglucosamine transferase